MFRPAHSLLLLLLGATFLACAARKSPSELSVSGTGVATDCHRPSGMFGPVALPKSALSSRNGSNTQRFSTISTSLASPVEVCGVEEQLVWLTRVTCDDGSNPFPGLRGAHGSRAGSVGQGGRCGSIIDLYRVPCPEKTYEVYMDLYMCGE